MQLRFVVGAHEDIDNKLPLASFLLVHLTCLLPAEDAKHTEDSLLRGLLVYMNATGGGC